MSAARANRPVGRRRKAERLTHHEMFRHTEIWNRHASMSSGASESAKISRRSGVECPARRVHGRPPLIARYRLSRRRLSMRMVARLIFAAALIALLPAAALAQTSAIAGVVKDSSGAVLPGVTVEASS